MRRTTLAISIIAFLLLSTSLLSAQQTGATKRNGPVIRLESDTIDLGEIQIGKIDPKHGKVRFVVLNNGNKPLILSKVSGCCGTEIKSHTKAPILPKQQGEIQVEFRIEPKLQAISRTVTITSNAINASEIQGHIVGKVVKNAEPGRLPI